ncbi:tRNA 4-thiouridine(8) synthase ThiI [Candidatus Woesearchaeota archaeon]|nr:tRNA 4-thiouridine(8) synthase ThiI [Candidatus Woesearchaeota archaeon]
MFVVVHYEEIGTKGKNRSMFEKKLVDNIRSSLSKNSYESIKRSYGRILIELKLDNKVDIKEILKKISGIANFSFAVKAELDIEDIKKELLKIAEKNKEKTFRISSRRGHKEFPYDSQKLNEELGAYLVEKCDMKVSLSKPEIAFFVEITEKGAFIYTDKIKGIGGLPVGATGKVVSLISGGLDSPVAAWKMFRRGCSVVFVHFNNETLNKSGVEDKIVKLVEKLSHYQFKTRLYLIPFGRLQNEIIKVIPSKYRMIVYRRVMFKIAEKILENEKALEFVTGDSVAQVASQTLENIKVIYASAKSPVLSPLIGENKKDIIKIAEEIGTFELSTLPYEDCCSFLIDKHPETKAKLENIEKLEENLKINNLIEESIEKANIKVFMNKRF